MFQGMLDKIYAMGDPPDYEPPHETDVAGIAAAAGADPLELAYDLLNETTATPS